MKDKIMTNIEMDVARSTIRMNNAVTDHLQEIDWEQRRYEIAKISIPKCLECATTVLMKGETLPFNTLAETVAKNAIMYADALIEELKNPQTQK